MKKRGLGRGLQALLADTAEAGTGSDIRQLPIELLQNSDLQPRHSFDEAALDALTDSIRTHGILQPLLVRPLDALGEAYEIVAGERRWRAAQRCGLLEVPALVRTLDDREALEAALLENVQRADLTPLEEAEGYQRLIEQFGYTQEALGDNIGKSRSHIANLLRLLDLPVHLKAWLEEGKLSVGHARALLVADDPVALARIVMAEDLNVRQTEALVKAEGRIQAHAKRATALPDPDIKALEERLTATLGLKVQLQTKGKGGRLSIAYTSVEQLDGIIDRLS